MFVIKFCRVVVSEAYVTTHEFIEVVNYQYHSTRDFFRKRKTKQSLLKKMHHANSYAEWKSYAQEFDKLKDVQSWKETLESDDYDYEYIQRITQLLRETREKDEFVKLIHIIRSNSMRNIGNILDAALFSQSYVGTKDLIEDFQQEMVACLEYIATLPRNKMSRSKKLEFFAETRHAFGRTAIVFSGGAGIGRYHYGVVKCLYEEGLLPRIVAGSSVGSLFASFLCTRKLENLEEMLNPDRINYNAYRKRNEKYSLIRKIRRLFVEGYLMDINVIRDFVRDNIGDITFQEAYDKTGWILNITATGYGEHDNYRLLNYLTAPNVLIWSAVCASCALPHIFGPVDLYCKDENNQITLYIPGSKKFVDGSIAADVPIKLLSEMFNVNQFIVSQTNPWIIPFLNQSEHLRYSRKTILYKAFELVKDLIGSELQHRVNQLARIGIVPKAVSRYFNLITQTYSGNVTLFPKANLNDYFNILTNPTPEFLREGLSVGSRRVYHKVNHIAAILVIEKALEKNYLLVRSSSEKKVFLDEIEESDIDDKLPELRRDVVSGMKCDEDEDEISNNKPRRINSFRIPRTSSLDLLKHLVKTYETYNSNTPANNNK